MPQKPTSAPELVRFKDVRARIPLSRKSWLKLVREGKAPKPYRLNDRITFYKTADVERFVKDLINFEQ